MTIPRQNKVAEVVRRLNDVQKRANALGTDEGQVVYLHFVSEMDVPDICGICGLSPARVRLALGDFVGDLLAKWGRHTDRVAPRTRLSCPVTGFGLLRDYFFSPDGRSSWPSQPSMTNLIATALQLGAASCVAPHNYQIEALIEAVEAGGASYRARPVQCDDHRISGEGCWEWGYGEESAPASPPHSQDDQVPAVTRRETSPSKRNPSTGHPRTCQDTRGEVVTYQNRERHVRSVVNGQPPRLGEERYDLLIDCQAPRAVIRHPSGKISEYKGSLPGIGHRTWNLLGELLLQPGHYVTAGEMRESVSDATEHSGAMSLAARVAILRRLFAENGQEPWFFCTKSPFAVAFNPDRSYCIIRRTQ